MLQYIINRSQKGNKDLLLEQSQYYLSSELQGEIMTIAQQWEEEGMQKGIQEGMRKGVQKGEADLMMRLIQRRFGEIPYYYVQRITQADAQTLLLWGERVLDAVTLEEIFTDL